HGVWDVPPGITTFSALAASRSLFKELHKDTAVATCSMYEGSHPNIRTIDERLTLRCRYSGSELPNAVSPGLISIDNPRSATYHFMDATGQERAIPSNKTEAEVRQMVSDFGQHRSSGNFTLASYDEHCHSKEREELLKLVPYGADNMLLDHANHMTLDRFNR